MKRIYKGRKYDTETAEEVAKYENEYSRNDFEFCIETLYKKRTGEFFLHGEGGAMSKYAKSCGQNNWCSGEKIIPLTYENAQEWAEEHLDGEKYEKIFGKVSEGEKTRITVWLSSSNADKIKRMAVEKGVSMSEMIEKLIEEK